MGVRYWYKTYRTQHILDQFQVKQAHFYPLAPNETPSSVVHVVQDEILLSNHPFLPYGSFEGIFCVWIFLLTMVGI